MFVNHVKERHVNPARRSSQFITLITMTLQHNHVHNFRDVIWKFFIIVIFATVVEAERKKALTCFYCHTLDHGDSCKNINSTFNASLHSKELTAQCSPGDKYCTSRRFSFSLNGTDSKVWMMERNCSGQCTNECIITGDRSKLHLCTSCCQVDLCNSDNGASAISHNVHFVVLVLSLLCLYRKE